MLYREIIAVCSQIHTKHINTLWGQNVDIGMLNLAVHINPYPTVFPYGNGVVLHFYQQQESSTTKTIHKVINKGLKTYV